MSSDTKPSDAAPPPYTKQIDDSSTDSDTDTDVEGGLEAVDTKIPHRAQSGGLTLPGVIPRKY